MRVWGRVYDEHANASWQEVTTDTKGDNDAVYLTALAQCLKLNTGESPFFADRGIPARKSVITQVFPDYYVMQIQAQYAPFFASLNITRINQPGDPVYTVTAVTKKGSTLGVNIPQ